MSKVAREYTSNVISSVTCMSYPVCFLFHKQNDERFPSFQKCLPCKVGNICSVDTPLELQTTIDIRCTTSGILIECSTRQQPPGTPEPPNFFPRESKYLRALALLLWIATAADVDGELNNDPFFL